LIKENQIDFLSITLKAKLNLIILNFLINLNVKFSLADSANFADKKNLHNLRNPQEY